MSLSYQPIPSRILLDPRVSLVGDYTYLIQKSGKQNTYQQIISQNISQSSLSFTTVPPNLQTFVNRKLYLGVPIRFSFTGTTTAPGSGLLQIGQHDALKAYPLQNYLFSTSSCTINNTNVAINSSDFIEPLLRTNMNIQLEKYDFSLTPTYMDTYQNYEDFENGAYGSLPNSFSGTAPYPINLINNNSNVSSNNNPLGAYGLNYEGGGRGGFPYAIVENTDTTAIVDVYIVEQLFLPPFEFGHHYHPGFIGINQMNFQFNLNSLAIGGPGSFSNMWAHSNEGNTLTSISAQIIGPSSGLTPGFAYPQAMPTLFMNYITPYSSELQNLPPLLTYPYYEIIRFPTDTPGVVNPNTRVSAFASNNIQINSVPNRIYMVVKRRNQDKTYNTTDTYARIDKVSINWMNRNSLLGSATSVDLFNISVHNGVRLTWEEWSRYVGSILCINPAFDLGEEDQSISNGLLENIQLQVNIDFTNLNLSEAITFSFYIICVNEGTFTIDTTNNSARQQIGVISRQEILDAALLDKIDYNHAINMWGGDLVSSVKSGLKHIQSFAKSAAPYAKKAIQWGVKYGPKIIEGIEGIESLASVAAGDGIHPPRRHSRRRALKDRYY